MTNLNKLEMYDVLAKGSKLPRRHVQRLMEDFFQVVHNRLYRGHRVVISGFGTFETRNRPARKGRNPSTGEIMELPKMVTVHFVPAKSFRRSIRRK